MRNKFDNAIFFSNIAFLLKRRGMKIGEFEVAAGVKPGYISRAKKNSNSAPGIDFIMSASSLLQVSVDTLLSFDYSSLSPSEEYLLSFLERLSDDTLNDRLDWHGDKPDKLNNLGKADNHPLFSRFSVAVEGDNSEQAGRTTVKRFCSKHFGEQTVIAGDCFSLYIQGAVLYIMNVKDASLKDSSANIIEMWMKSTGYDEQCLCDSSQYSLFSHMVTQLYQLIIESNKHPRIGKSLVKAIDNYMATGKTITDD